MPSFDIINKLDLQKIDNAINTAKKELLNRYDLKDEECLIELDKKNKCIHLEANQEMAVKSLIDIVLSKFTKQQVDPRTLDLEKENHPSGKKILRDLPVKEGIEKETAKKVVQFIKDTKIKAQASINDDQVRVTAKQIDDLQSIMTKIRSHDFGIPLQFDNMRS